MHHTDTPLSIRVRGGRRKSSQVVARRTSARVSATTLAQSAVATSFQARCPRLVLRLAISSRRRRPCMGARRQVCIHAYMSAIAHNNLHRGVCLGWVCPHPWRTTAHARCVHVRSSRVCASNARVFTNAWRV